MRSARQDAHHAPRMAPPGWCRAARLWVDRLLAAKVARDAGAAVARVAHSLAEHLGAARRGEERVKVDAGGSMILLVAIVATATTTLLPPPPPAPAGRVPPEARQVLGCVVLADACARLPLVHLEQLGPHAPPLRVGRHGARLGQELAFELFLLLLVLLLLLWLLRRRRRASRGSAAAVLLLVILIPARGSVGGGVGVDDDDRASSSWSCRRHRRHRQLPSRALARRALHACGWPRRSVLQVQGIQLHVRERQRQRRHFEESRSGDGSLDPFCASLPVQTRGESMLRDDECFVCERCAGG